MLFRSEETGKLRVLTRAKIRTQGSDYLQIRNQPALSRLRLLRLAGVERCPRVRGHVAQFGRLPIILRMRGEEWLGIKSLSAGMAGVRDQTHFSSHLAVGDFALHRTHGIVRLHAPSLVALRRIVSVAAQRTNVGAIRFRVGVEMVALEFIWICLLTL